MASSSKRKFDTFNSTGDLSNITGAELKAKAVRTIYALDIAALREIAVHAYVTVPRIADHIDSKYALKPAAKDAARAPAKDFSSFSKSCWHALNTQHKRLKTSQQFSATGDVLAILESSRQKILKEAGPDTVWQTRRNALEVLRKICKSIVLCEVQVIRHELMKDGVVLGEFMGTMCEIARGFGEEERERYEDEGLLEKIEELKEVCGDWEVDMPELEDLLGIFGR
ncbi:hypothetical protein ONS95_003595 [Cadophora gregata]|uniref:uncharacterized protein n=1 Tax=Cadophora gregata TaxID=51156 RepID=UPI0026DB49B5|nr:uncharacterized protein ONS95_003595 [Cadophora gregata]KAK0106873.1 hypothetical protein ONS95_003595 [Cadophora gregata]